MIMELSHPLAKHYLSIIRNEKSSTDLFRDASKKLALFLAIECSKDIRISHTFIQTPLESIESEKFDDDVVLLPILRAGMLLVEPFMNIIPSSKLGFIGIKRNESTFEPQEYYFSMPNSPTKSLIIILDPMIATGGSILATIEKLHNLNYFRIIIASLICAPEGVGNIENRFPDIKLITVSQDRCLNDIGYILPGLGDAGDRYCGSI